MFMLKYLPLVALLLATACTMEKEKEKEPLYTSPAFTVYADGVVQGDNVASVLSPTHLRSNYRSPASATFSRLVQFKISINEKDNELPPGQNHWVLIGDEHESAIIPFGSAPAPVPDNPLTYLPVNYPYTFRVDMSAVLDQFARQGYFEAFDGSKVAQADFKGFYVAGGSLPLSWDFVGLDEKGLKLQPTADPNIYTLSVILNPFKETDTQDREWQLTTDLTSRPQYHSDQPLVDALFNLSLEEATKNIEPDSTFRTGAKWAGVWTRDISYSIILAFAYHEPEVAKISLRKKVKRGRIIQDTGSGGAWPVSSDRTTWVLAAWEIYQVTGDEAWLEEIYPIIKNTLDDDYLTLYDPQTGMFCGESSFLDWREQTYPKWMSNMDIYVSQNLGTNVVHYRAEQIMADLAKIRGEPWEVYAQRAAQIKKGINAHLWLPDRGYYAQYVYGRPELVTSPRFEALGEALAVLYGVADPERAAAIVSRSPVTDYGVTCIYPQIPGIPPYHNNGIWPFVQSYWNLAAAKAGNEAVLNQGLASIYRAGALFLTNYENFVAQTSDFLGTEINSDRMLWSMAGNLAMVHRVFMGMSFTPAGLSFQPAVPQVYGGSRSLTNFKYRRALLDITVNGFGNRVQSMTMDGQPLAGNLVPHDLVGKHEIRIELANNPFPGKGINRVPNHFSLPAPQVNTNGNRLEWQLVGGGTAKYYLVYRNGVLVEKTTATQYEVPPANYANYQVSAVDDPGYESFTSEPIIFANTVLQFELENYAPLAKLAYTNFSGKGFVEVSTTGNRAIEMKITVPKAGNYRLDLRYSNGSGPWNTDNKCAIRSLSVNGAYQGVLVLPQRGQDEWSDWGFSNSRQVALMAGENTVKISLEDWNNNMNVDVNTAMLDYLRVTAVDN